MQHHRHRSDQLSLTLGWVSLGLGASQVMAPRVLARAAGLGDSARAPAVIRAVGVREIGHGAALLTGPSRMVWTRVGGDVLDLAALGWALRRGDGRRRRRTVAATATVAGLAAVDLYAALRPGRGGQHGDGRPGPLVARASVTVNRPPDEVYAYWRDFARLPTFMRHLESVTRRPDGRWHWRATAPFGRSVAWIAELTGDEPGRRISWQSLPGSDVDNSGTVHFAPAPGDRGTEVRVVLHYDVPGGTAGQLVAKLAGEEPDQQVHDELRRFKQVLETGEVVRSDALPGGAEAGRQLFQRSGRPSGRETGGRRTR